MTDCNPTQYLPAKIRINSALFVCFTVCLFAFGMLFCSQATAQSANLQVGPAAGSAGSAVSIPITFTPGASSISTLQFDLVFPGSLSYASATTGPAAASAGKSASAGSIPGGVRVLVFGLNQNTIGPGVIANVQLYISAAAPVGSTPVGISGIVASGPAANEVAVFGMAGSITRLAADGTPPLITSVSSSNVTISSANITWITNEGADSQVQYGTSTAYESTTALNGALAVSHSQLLTGLVANTVYHFQAISKDSAGNMSVSGDYTFTTKAAGASPVISGVTISNVTDKTASISWSTDALSDSQVEYWAANQNTGRAVLGDLVTSHSLTLNQLQTSTTYYFRVKSTDPDGNQASTSEFTFTTTVTGASELAMPRFAAPSTGLQMAPQTGNDNLIGLAVTNTGSAPANLTFTALDSSGNLISGAGITNPRSWVLNPESQQGIVDIEIFGDAFAGLNTNGWIKLETTSPDVRGFFLAFDAPLNLMDGANLGSSRLTNFAFTEIEPAGSTRINLANENPDTATVSFDLMKSDGTVRSSQSRVISGNGALVADLYGDLFNGFVPDPTDYVRMRSSQGVEPFELMDKSAGDISSLTGQDITTGGTTLYSPQYVFGGPWKTSLSIINLDARTGMVTMRFVGSDGVQIGSERAVAIPALGKVYINDPGFFATLNPETVVGGYLEIVSDGIRLAGSTVFGDSSGQSFASALPLITSLQKSTVFSHIASDDQYWTGIAIVNPNATNANIRIEVYDEAGQLIDSISQSIGARQRISRLLWQYCGALAGRNMRSGYIRLTSDLPLGSFALFGTNNLSVLSAIPAQTN